MNWPRTVMSLVSPYTFITSMFRSATVSESGNSGWLA